MERQFRLPLVQGYRKVTGMDWVTLAIIGGGAAAFVGLKQLGLVGVAAAREHLRRGAKVIDVRSPQEFGSRHLPGAINIPLGELSDRIAAKVPNKDTVLLLHCLSGGRSALGKRTLKGLGYSQVFNLGSYGRAEKIVRGK